MNPRQRRGVLLLVATALGAVLVFVTLFAYTSSVSSQVGPMAQVVRLKEGVAELQEITPEVVEVTQMPARWAPDSAYASVEEVVGLVAAGDYDGQVTLQEGMLREPPGLQPGYREVAIMVDAETGVAGKVTPGDRVDILATTEDPATEAQSAEVWVSNALVVEVGIPQEIETEDGDGGFGSGEGVPVTFALAGPDALRLAYAESFAVKLRLALRGDGDLDAVPDADRRFDRSMPVESGALPAGVVADEKPAPAPSEEPKREEPKPAPAPSEEPGPEEPKPAEPKPQGHPSADQPQPEPAKEGQ